MSGDDAPDFGADPDSDEGTVAGVGDDTFDDIAEFTDSDIADAVSADDEEEDGRDDKEETKKKSRMAAVMVGVAAVGEEAPRPLETAAIVDQVIGPGLVRPEEIQQFMLDSFNIVPYEMFKRQFREHLTDPARKETLLRLMREMLSSKEVNGTKYVTLKKARKR
jgi:hypothetical protein